MCHTYDGLHLERKNKKQKTKNKIMEYPNNRVNKNQLNWFGPIKRQRKTSKTKAAINKSYENLRPRKRWIDHILGSLET